MMCEVCQEISWPGESHACVSVGRAEREQAGARGMKEAWAALQSVPSYVEQQARVFGQEATIPSIATRGTLNPQRGFTLLR